MNGRADLIYVEIAALARSAGGVDAESAGERVAAKIIALIRRSAVALFARFHEHVATFRTVEQTGLFIHHHSNKFNNQLVSSS